MLEIIILGKGTRIVVKWDHIARADEYEICVDCKIEKGKVIIQNHNKTILNALINVSL
tara:strand:- start:212 stop:385 length:174 start_codon:yes stop_codon:yes gene_type:complete